MNYEASVRVDDADGALAAKVAAHFDELIEGEFVVPATKGKIDDYAREFAVHRAWRDMAKRRADKVNREGVPDLNDWPVARRSRFRMRRASSPPTGRPARSHAESPSADSRLRP